MKKNIIFKVLGVVMSTLIVFTLCFCKFNKVDASSINDYQDENYWFRGASAYNGINDINDLKGKTFSIPYVTYIYLLQTFSLGGSFDVFINILERDYIGVEINEQTHETIQCVDYLQYPYIIVEKNILDSNENLYTDFNIFSSYSETSENYSFFYANDSFLNPFSSIQIKGSLVNQRINNFAYLPLDSLQERENVPLMYINIEWFNEHSYIDNTCNFNFLNEEDFLNSLSSGLMIDSTLLNFYFVFPNTDRYSLSYNSSLPLSFFNNFNYIQPYNANIEDKNAYASEIGDVAYNNGYNAGFLDGTTGGGVFSIFTGIITSVNGILQMEIFPNVKLGYFIWLPLTLGVVGLILTFWRKD